MIDTKAIRSKILDLALRGLLTEQLPKDGTAEELYQQIQVEKQELIKVGKIKKEKPLPEITENEKPFDIPESWKWVRLDNIVKKEIKRGKSPNYVPKSGTLVFAQKCNTKAGNINLTLSLFLDETKLGKYSESEYMRDQDIVINSTGHGTLGRVGLYRNSDNPNQMPIVPDSHVTVIRVGSAIYAKYVFHVLKYYQPYMEEFGSGSTNQAELSANTVKALLFPLPPLAEQKRIVEKIEQTFFVLDTIDDLQTKYANNLSALKSKLIDAAIQGKLTKQLTEDGTAEELYQKLAIQKKEIEKSGVLKGRKKKAVLSLNDDEIPFEIPETWKWIRFDAVAEIFGRIGFRGYTKNDIVEQGKGAISLSPSNITKDGKIIFDKNTYISWEKYAESPEIMVNEEDIIIVKTGSSYGKCAVAKSLPEKATINPQLAVLKYLLCDRYYLYYVLNSSMAHKQYEDFVVGAATPTFSQEDLANFILPLPPLAEQKRIVKKLETVLAVLD